MLLQVRQRGLPNFRETHTHTPRQAGCGQRVLFRVVLSIERPLQLDAVVFSCWYGPCPGGEAQHRVG